MIYQEGCTMKNTEQEYNEEFDYDYSKIKEEPISEEIQNLHVKSSSNRWLLVMIQIMVCFICFVTIFSLKMIGGEVYETVKEWYLENINNSIIAKQTVDEVKQTCFNLFSKPQTQEEDKSTESQTISEASSTETEESKLLQTTSIYSSAPLYLTVALSPPLKEGILTSKFGIRDNEVHKGIDIAAEEGEAIYSVLAGTVEIAEENSSYGKYVVITHGNSIKSLYAHCSSLQVNKGDTVKVGQQIAKVGTTGDSTGPHLHLELLIGDFVYNPEPILKKGYI